MKIFLWTFICTTLHTAIQAQVAPEAGHVHTRIIDFPDVPGYLTLNCDLHIHTVFSDGLVWPDIRVQEALKDGLDAIAITDHIEYRPHEDDIPFPDANRPYLIAKKEAIEKNILVINGAEITRSMPPGHANALFLGDGNTLVLDDSVAQFEAANAQGAFVFWNHPAWASQRSDGIATVLPMHKKLIDNGLLHGIEVVNEHVYSDEALQIALDNNLTIMSTSDIHGLIDWDYNISGGGHRPVTLVFCTEKSESALQEALMQKRTVAFFEDNLIGRPEFINPLLEACLVVENAEYMHNSEILKINLVNQSSVNFILVNNSEFALHEDTDVVTIPNHSEVELKLKTRRLLGKLTLNFMVMNALTAPKTHPILELEITPNKN